MINKCNNIIMQFTIIILMYETPSKQQPVVVATTGRYVGYAMRHILRSILVAWY